VGSIWAEISRGGDMSCDVGTMNVMVSRRPMVHSRTAVQTAQRYYHRPRRSFLSPPAVILPAPMLDVLAMFLGRRTESHLEQTHVSVGAHHQLHRPNRHDIAPIFDLVVPLFGAVVAAVAWTKKRHDLS